MTTDQNRDFQVLIQGARFRLTLAKNRVTIKIPPTASIADAELWSKWCHQVADMDFARVPGVTLRCDVSKLEKRVDGLWFRNNQGKVMCKVSGPCEGAGTVLGFGK